MANAIQRGTTPTISFTVPTGTPNIDEGSVTLSQNGNVVVRKMLNECSHAGNVVSVQLTQEDTLKLSSFYPVEIQLKLKFDDGKVPKTKIHTLPVDRVLDEEAI